MDEVDVNEVAHELRLVVGRLVRRARRPEDLPTPQAAVLGHLDREGPLTTADLAERQRVRHQSMARTVGRLTALGLIAAGPHPSDARKTLLTITDAGRAELQSQRTRRTDWLAEAMASEFDPEEQRDLARAVALLARLADR
ncbi:MarR family winged helix-turn-helix transcriptional regulator [Actinoallomurus rhizosphaericola]|uniref:MarR family winged helix-turn-helix transcriptional regulator n=1 Tax=Actinoallomurus rhizosphaericola TaxID=2952536 RepID=UPI00209021CD|nr:MarR family transcriptional regulator [Actinoallomurus rhizosphaericola]MCO5992945.1 MarR family transcriptional regulator [Actinoallomurus rhizosphaericola]